MKVVIFTNEQFAQVGFAVRKAQIEKLNAEPEAANHCLGALQALHNANTLTDTAVFGNEKVLMCQTNSDIF